jgi:hypothetical protein
VENRTDVRFRPRKSITDCATNSATDSRLIGGAPASRIAPGGASSPHQNDANFAARCGVEHQREIIQTSNVICEIYGSGIHLEGVICNIISFGETDMPSHVKPALLNGRA